MKHRATGWDDDEDELAGIASVFDDGHPSADAGGWLPGEIDRGFGHDEVTAGIAAEFAAVLTAPPAADEALTDQAHTDQAPAAVEATPQLPPAWRWYAFRLLLAVVISAVLAVVAVAALRYGRTHDSKPTTMSTESVVSAVHVRPASVGEGMIVP